MENKQEIELYLGECTGCGACIELSPIFFAWDEYNERPILLQTIATQEDLEITINFCPGDCIALGKSK